MRYPLLLLALFLQCFAFGVRGANSINYTGQFPSHTDAFSATQLTIQNTVRNMWVYRPSNQAHLPLLIFFSGTGGTLEYSTLDEIGKNALKEFADREGVIIVAPLPRNIDQGDWDHGAGAPYWETAMTSDLQSPVNLDPATNPDLLLVEAIMDEAIESYQIDSNRIYLNGFSSGAFFSYFAAAVLHERIAAFAETGGGLVLSRTTSGDPVCQINPVSAPSGSDLSCQMTGWTTQSCVTPNAIARPIAPTSIDWVPPAFLTANDDDGSVPFAHTCHLANRLSNETEVQVHIIHQGGGHIVPKGYWDDAWNFMKTKRLETALFKAADRIFDYAETQFAPVFTPMPQTSQIGFGFYYRYYPNSNSYLGYQNQNIWYFLPNTGIREAGPLSQYLPLAKAAQLQR